MSQISHRRARRAAEGWRTDYVMATLAVLIGSVYAANGKQ